MTGGPFCLLIPTPLNRQFLRHGQGHHDYGSHHGRQADSRDDTGGRPNDQGGAAPLPALPRSPRAAAAPPATQPGRLPRAGWARREQGRRSGGEKLSCSLLALSRLPPAPADHPQRLAQWVLWTAVAPTARRGAARPPGACGLFVLRGHLRRPTPPLPLSCPPCTCHCRWRAHTWNPSCVAWCWAWDAPRCLRRHTSAPRQARPALPGDGRRGAAPLGAGGWAGVGSSCCSTAVSRAAGHTALTMFCCQSQSVPLKPAPSSAVSGHVGHHRRPAGAGGGRPAALPR